MKTHFQCCNFAFDKTWNRRIKESLLILFILTLSLNSFSQFSDSGINLGTVGYNKCQWGDYDNDGDLDILLAGYSSKVFRNNGNKTFTDISVLFSVIGYTGTWIDFDNDNDLDILIGTKLYKNLGSDVFKEIILDELNEYNNGNSSFSSIDAADYDNDGDDDILLGYGGKIIMLNNKDSKFIRVDPNLIGGENIGNNYINNLFFDSDNDGYLDILSSKLHKNNTNNQFVNDLTFNITDKGYVVTTGDYNSDGFMDALYSEGSYSMLMKNTGGTFSKASLTSLSGISDSWNSRFGDFNNDGKLDFVMMLSSSGKLFSNNGAGDFVKTDLIHSLGNVLDEAWGDFDKDGDLDLLIVGKTQSRIFENLQTQVNNAPGVPSGLVNTIKGNSVTFSWTKPADPETPIAGLTYNICLINTSINDTIKSPHANLTTGSLLEPKTGNTQSNNFWTIKGLRSGNYKWTVQAIDNSFKGSSFATFKTFTISASSAISPSIPQRIDPNIAGTTLSLTETGSVSGRKWVSGIYPGGPYTSILPGTTAFLAPKFPEDGRYFIMCKSVSGSDTLYSNEVMVDVFPFTETSVTGIPNWWTGSFKPGDYDNDGDLDLLATGDQGTRIYKNTNNVYTAIVITTGLYNGDAAWVDLNNDNKLDFIITGGTDQSAASPKKTRIFINQGNGTFSELSTTIIGLAFGSIDAGDYDHDGDQDIIISGMDTEPVTKIYRNDNGSYIDIKAQINQVTDGMAKWVDYDNDDDLDIFLSGTDFSGNPFTSLYTNNGSDQFNVLSSSFDQVKYSFVDLGDYDNDSDIDILLSGTASSNEVKPTIYKNLGGGNFQKIVLVSDQGYNYVKFIDYNNDNLLDVLLVGNEWYSYSYTEKSKVHTILKNFGNDVFHEIPYRKPWVNNSKLLGLADLDNDSDVDMIQAERDLNTNGQKVTAYFNKSYIVKPVPATPTNLSSERRGKDIILKWKKPTNLTGLSYDVAIGSSPGSFNIVAPQSQVSTGYRMIPQSGFISDTIYSAAISTKGTYYWSVQAINNSFKGSPFAASASFVIGDYFTETASPFIQSGYQIDFDWGDYDSDGDQDLLFCGKYWQSPNWLQFSYVYSNNGNGTFNSTPAFDLGYEGFELKWIDIDNDNDLDIAGCMGPYSSRFVIFENKGAGSFVEVYNVSNNSTDFSYGDYNNDGLPDFLVSSVKILLNNGHFSFTTCPANITMNRTSYSFVDLNNDLKEDLITQSDSIRIYKRTDNGFEKVHFTLAKFDNSRTNFTTGDLDNDGDLDILVTGCYYGDPKITWILRNDGNFNFTKIPDIIRGTEYGSVSVGDYDNDNDLDILISGSSFSIITNVYENKGNLSFEEKNYPITGQSQGMSGWSDIDGDGDLDILVSGTGSSGNLTKLFKNDLNIPPASVSVPSNLKSESYGYGVLLSWTDSLKSGSSYNVRIGTQPGLADIVSPMSDLNSGKRKVSRIGNTGMNKSFMLKTLPVGKYYWSVQTVNNAFKGGSWTAEKSFTITVLNPAFTSDIVCAGDSTRFADNSITSGEPIVGWKWYFGDGVTSILKNPVHKYPNAGNFSAKLVVSTASYKDSISKTIVIKSRAIPDFTAPASCQGSSTTITNTTNFNGLTISSWYWDFGDGQTSLLQNPGSHGYLGASNYTAILRTLDSNGCTSEISKTVTVVGDPVAAISADGATTFCSGNSVTLSTPLNADYSYIWKRDGSAITGATSNSYIGQIQGSYTVLVTNKGLCTKLSSAVSVVVNNIPAAPLISASGPLSFCQGEAVDLNVSYITGNTYQWRRDGGAVGTNSNIYSANAQGNYTVVVTNSSNCSTNSSNSIDIVINPKPSIPTVNIRGATTFCQGENVELSVTSVAGYTYQWENNGSAITDAKTSTFIANVPGIFALKITNSNNCLSRTENVTVSVNNSPSAPAISADRPLTFCEGDSTILSISNIPGYSYQWKLNGGAVGTNSNQYIAKNEGEYKLLVTSNNGCSVNSSNAINVVVNPIPALSAVSLSGPVQFCKGSNLILSVPSISGYSYGWRNEAGLIDNAKTNSYTASVSGKYQLEISNVLGCIVKTTAVNVVVKPVPQKPVVDPGIYQEGKCPGESPIKLSVINADSGSSYQWFKNGVAISNANAISYQEFLQQGIYKVEVSMGDCSVQSEALNVIFDDAPIKPDLIAKGPSVWILSCKTKDATSYKWYLNGSVIPGANTYQYVANNRLGTYNVSISNAKGCFTISDAVTIPTGITGIEDTDPFKDMILYPNPTSGLFSIIMENQLQGSVLILVLDQSGKEVKTIKTEKISDHFEKQIDLSGQSKGMYVIKTTLGKMTDTRKVIVK